MVYAASVAVRRPTEREAEASEHFGPLTSFDTRAAPVVDFFALAQRGRGLTTLDAIGPANGFRQQDIVLLLQAVAGRLDTLG